MNPEDEEITGYIITSHYAGHLQYIHNDARDEPMAWNYVAQREKEGHTAIRIWAYPAMVEVQRPKPEYLIHCADTDDWFTHSTPGRPLEQCHDDEVFIREANGDFRKLTAEEVEALG